MALTADDVATERATKRAGDVAGRLGRRLGDLWDRLETRDDGDVERFAALASPAVVAAQTVAADLVVAYLDAIGDPNPSAGTLDADQLDDLEPDYRSPFIVYWSALKRGEPWTLAVVAGRDRAVRLGHDAARRATDAAYRGSE